MTEQVSVKDFGEKLRQARLAQSRSLDDIAAQTRIHRRHLEAIEAGEIGHLPEGPYVKAFIREYARALGVKVPAEFAAPIAGPDPNAKDPKVVSRPAAPAEKSEEEDVLPITAVAKETVRFANSAVNSAVRSVAKTTEMMVDFVETGSKEALEVLTSKTLWDEAEDVRRERLGLAPKAPAHPVAPPVAALPPTTERPATGEAPLTIDASSIPSRSTPVRAELSGGRVSSRGATNVIIALLVILFAGAVVYAIRTYKRDVGTLTTEHDYVPAPVDRPTLPATEKRPAKTPETTAPAAAVIGPNDSVRFQIRATDPVWISVAPDGVPAYRGELKSGEVRTFKAGERIVVNIGNQKSVVMTLDGRPLTNLPTIPNSGVVVRDLVLTHDRATVGGQSTSLRPTPSTLPLPTPATPSGTTSASSGSKTTTSGTASGTPVSRPTSTTSSGTKSTIKKPSTSTKPSSKLPTIPPLNPIPPHP